MGRVDPRGVQGLGHMSLGRACAGDWQAAGAQSWGGGKQLEHGEQPEHVLRCDAEGSLGSTWCERKAGSLEPGKGQYSSLDLFVACQSQHTTDQGLALGWFSFV